jgi:hypothetical protein
MSMLGGLEVVVERCASSPHARAAGGFKCGCSPCRSAGHGAAHRGRARSRPRTDLNEAATDARAHHARVHAARSRSTRGRRAGTGCYRSRTRTTTTCFCSSRWRRSPTGGRSSTRCGRSRAGRSGGPALPQPQAQPQVQPTAGVDPRRCARGRARRRATLRLSPTAGRARRRRSRSRAHQVRRGLPTTPDTTRSAAPHRPRAASGAARGRSRALRWAARPTRPTRMPNASVGRRSPRWSESAPSGRSASELQPPATEQGTRRRTLSCLIRAASHTAAHTAALHGPQAPTPSGSHTTGHKLGTQLAGQRPPHRRPRCRPSRERSHNSDHDTHPPRRSAIAIASYPQPPA